MLIRGVKRLSSGKISYRGYTFSGFNKPQHSPLKTKKMVVLAKQGSQVKLVHFGHPSYQDYTQHKSKQRRANYLARSAGIRDKTGRLTKDNKLSANYWARKILW